MIILDLPWPNSTNTHWRHARGRTFISPAGIAFRAAVKLAARPNNQKAPEGRLDVGVQLYPPDKRVRDLDNFGTKSLLDSLTHAGVIEDDSLIDRLLIERMPIVKGGKCRVFIKTYKAEHEENAS